MKGMTEFPKPIVVVSKCIEFQPVRWNSEIISSDFVRRLKHCVTLIPICPEVEMGLSVPRNPLRVVSSDGKLKLVQHDTGIDLTDKMLMFAESYLNSLPAVDGFILKSSSPSCAPRDAKVYLDCLEPAPTARGPGLFAQKALHKYPHLAVEDEKRLEDPQTAKQFIKKVFTSARLRQVKASMLQKPQVDLKSGRRVLHHTRSRVRARRKLR
jgi:uncharacterized protein YbbK (DUF523 family)